MVKRAINGACEIDSFLYLLLIEPSFQVSYFPGWVGRGEIDITSNSAQVELELGLSPQNY